MTANFVFPPPPPPPPSVNTQNLAPASYGSQSGNWNTSRGRGRGGGYRGQRGGSRGGYGNTWSAPGLTHGASGGSGYSYQQRNGFSNSQPPLNYGISTSQQYGQIREPWHQNSTGHASQAPYQQYRAPNSSPSPAHGQQPFTSHSSSLTYIRKPAVHDAGPVAMGPPIRMGFTDAQDGPYAASPNQSFGATSTHYKIDNRPQNNSRGRGQKRQWGEAFSHKDVKPKPLTAPAVPSFGVPLVSPNPSAQEEGAQTKKKKKRQHNQLGLTPKNDEPDYSDEDVDEEAKLAASLMPTGGAQPLYSFSYRGKLTKLNSPEEIAAWIEERRKKFPTKLKAAEAKAQKALAEKRAREAKEKRAKEKQEQEEARKQSAQNNKNEKNKKGRNKAEKSKKAKELTEAEELKKKLAETEKRLAELEKRVRKSQKDKPKEDTKDVDLSSVTTKSPKAKRKRKSTKTRSEPLAPSQTLPPQTDTMPPIRNTSDDSTLPMIVRNDSDDSISLPSTELSDYDLEELTSSDSSSSSRSSSPDSHLSVSVSSSDLDSDSDSDSESDSDLDSISSTSSTASSAPSQHTISATHHIPSSPLRDIPESGDPTSDKLNYPPKQEPKRLCRNFLKHTKCHYGRKCRFRHRFADKAEETKYGGGQQRNGTSGDVGKGKSGGKGRDRGKVTKMGEESWEDRPSLYQRLLRKQIEEEEAEEREKNEREKEREEEEEEARGRSGGEGDGGGEEGNAMVAGREEKAEEGEDEEEEEENDEDESERAVAEERKRMEVIREKMKSGVDMSQGRLTRELQRLAR